MKDIILTVKRQKIEIGTLLVCFVLANLINLYAIISYDAPFSELWSTFFYILIFTIVLYGFWTVIRLLVYGVKLCLKKK